MKGGKVEQQKRYWLWVWLPRGKSKAGYDFDTRGEAEAYFNQHWRGEPVKHEITFEAC